jgi:hypothetical protein
MGLNQKKKCCKKEMRSEYSERMEISLFFSDKETRICLRVRMLAKKDILESY